MPELTIRPVEVRSVLSKSNLPVCEYSANPYVGCTHGCKYCYASFMKRFTGHPFIGSVTDPYLPQEESYGRTRALLSQLKGSGARISIATKSDLILRDLDLIKSFSDARVSWFVNTLNRAGLFALPGYFSYRAVPSASSPGRSRRQARSGVRTETGPPASRRTR